MPDLRERSWWDEDVTLFGQVVMVCFAFAIVGFFAVVVGAWGTGRPVTWKEPLLGAAILGLPMGAAVLRYPQRFGRGFGTRGQVFGSSLILGLLVLAYSLWRLTTP